MDYKESVDQFKKKYIKIGVSLRKVKKELKSAKFTLVFFISFDFFYAT